MRRHLLGLLARWRRRGCCPRASEAASSRTEKCEMQAAAAQQRVVSMSPAIISMLGALLLSLTTQRLAPRSDGADESLLSRAAHGKHSSVAPYERLPCGPSARTHAPSAPSRKRARGRAASPSPLTALTLAWDSPLLAASRAVRRTAQHAQCGSGAALRRPTAGRAAARC